MFGRRAVVVGNQGRRPVCAPVVRPGDSHAIVVAGVAAALQPVHEDAVVEDPHRGEIGPVDEEVVGFGDRCGHAPEAGRRRACGSDGSICGVFARRSCHRQRPRRRQRKRAHPDPNGQSECGVPRARARSSSSRSRRQWLRGGGRPIRGRPEARGREHRGPAGCPKCTRSGEGEQRGGPGSARRIAVVMIMRRPYRFRGGGVGGIWHRPFIQGKRGCHGCREWQSCTAKECDDDAEGLSSDDSAPGGRRARGIRHRDPSAWPGCCPPRASTSGATRSSTRADSISRFSPRRTGRSTITPKPETAIEDIARLAERWYERLSRSFQHDFDTTKQLIIYADQPDFQQTNTLQGAIGTGNGRGDRIAQEPGHHAAECLVPRDRPDSGPRAGCTPSSTTSRRAGAVAGSCGWRRCPSGLSREWRNTCQWDVNTPIRRCGCATTFCATTSPP